MAGRGRRGAAPRRRLPPRAAAGAEEVFGLTLPPDDVVDAVEKAGTRVTAADVAAAGGMDLEKARKGLVALAASIGGEASLEVSRSGEIVYVFPQDTRGALSRSSQAAGLREAWNSAKPALFTAARVAFGVALFASIAAVYSALLIISTSGSSDRDNRDDRRQDNFGGGGGFGGGGFGGGGFGFGPTLWYGPSPFDLFFYRPYYTYGGYDVYDMEQQKPKMGFLEAVYSLVFGDGDPNDGREQRALAAVAATVRRNGGVVTGEQLAPLLSPPSYGKASGTVNVDESWVLEALTRLNGRPEVTKGGQIVYVFPDLQTTAGEVSKDEKPPSVLKEKEVPFSLAEDDQLTFAGILGVLNLVGAGWLGVQFASLPAYVVLGGFLGAVKAIYPALLAYAIGFLAAPAARYFNLDGTNKDIQRRNRNREEWLDVLSSGEAEGKLAEARLYRTAMKQVGAGDDSVYSTSRDAASQQSTDDFADFDKQLKGG